MQQLLQITTVPIEYKFEIEHSRLQYKQAENPSADMRQSPARLNLNSENIKVRIDTMDMRRSLGFQTSMDVAVNSKEQGLKNVQQFMDNQAYIGRQMSQIQDGVKIGDVVKQKMLQQPESYMAFLPSAGPNISWTPAKLDVSYQKGDLGFDWNINKNIMEYIPGKFHMNIVQYPRVQVEYVGDPNYVPPSADPNYEG